MRPGEDASLVPAAPRVSVVIPAFNYAHFVGVAVKSVLDQTFTHFELLVVDDGSTDNTAAVVASVPDARVRYIYQRNAGLSAARNTGIAEARADLIAFLDADDVWLPEFLHRVIARFDELGPAWGLVATQAGRMNSAGDPWPAPQRRPLRSGSREVTVRDFCLRNLPLSSSLVARRAVFDECGGFEPALRSSEDRDMWIRATMRHRFWLIDERLAMIRRHPHNMSKQAPRMERNSRSTLLRAYRRGAVPRSDWAFWLQAFAVHYFIVAWTHFDSGLHARAFGYLGLSTLLWPVFLRPADISEPPLFRVRAFIHFCLRVLRRG